MAAASKPPKSTTPQHTPMMRQYLQFKEQVGDMILFCRVGDFYELFWEDAERASKLLDLTLTSRGESGGRPISMSGVPWHSLDLHLSRLVKLGESAAVVDQVGDPSKAIGPVERAITRIVTPGTLLDDALLSDKKNAPLLAIFPDGKQAGLFWVNLSSGESFFASVPMSMIPDEIARIHPAEILAPEGFKIQAEGSVFRNLEAWKFDASKGARALMDHFGTATLEPFGIQQHQECLSAACAAYVHASASMGGRRPHVQTLLQSDFSSFLKMDVATRRALEITLTQRHQESPTLFSCLDDCSSAMGSRQLRQWLTSPLRDAESISERLNAVEALMLKEAATSHFSLNMKGRTDVERVASRAANLATRPRDFSNLKFTLQALPSVLKHLDVVDNSFIRTLVQRAQKDLGTLAFLETVIKDEPSVFIRDGGVIKEGYSAELDELRNLSLNAAGMLTAMEEREKASTGIPTLRLDYSRAHGYAIEVTKAQSAKVPAHYRRKQTLKNTERYTTDELEEFERKALSAEEKSLALEKTLFEKAQQKLATFAPALLEMSKALASLDVLATFARLSLERNYCKPTIQAGSPLVVKQARHPVAERMMKHDFVPNDIALSPEQSSLLITGPNMGGKSTYMRSVAAVILMAQAGCFVPASSCQIPVFTQLFARVGSSDDIAGGQSTFMVEMSEAAGILRQADAQSLCIIDEIGRGTSTFDGMSLAWGILRHLHEKNKAYTLFSTHYFELTELASRLKGVENAHLTAHSEDGHIVFLHTVKPGAASQSHGIEVAKLAGVPQSVLVWARAMLAELSGNDPFKTTPAVALSNDPQAAPNPPPSGHQDAAQEAFFSAFSQIDPDALTPKEALETLYALQKLMPQST